VAQPRHGGSLTLVTLLPSKNTHPLTEAVKTAFDRARSASILKKTLGEKIFLSILLRE
jgi:hypothetical protein